MENQNKTQNTEGLKVPYSDRVGEDRDKEIFERYRAIIDYYTKNPHRITGNLIELENLCYRDTILKKDMPLRKTIHKLLINYYIDEGESLQN